MLCRFVSTKRRAQRRALGARQAQQRRVAVQTLLHEGVRPRVFRKELAPTPTRKVVFRHPPPKVQLLLHVAENVAQLEIFLCERLQKCDGFFEFLCVLSLEFHLVQQRSLVLLTPGVLALDLPLVAQQRVDQRLLHLPLVGRRRRRRRRKRLGSETAAGRDAF